MSLNILKAMSSDTDTDPVLEKMSCVCCKVQFQKPVLNSSATRIGLADVNNPSVFILPMLFSPLNDYSVMNSTMMSSESIVRVSLPLMTDGGRPLFPPSTSAASRDLRQCTVEEITLVSCGITRLKQYFKVPFYTALLLKKGFY